MEVEKLESFWDMFKVSNIHLSKSTANIFNDSQFNKVITVNDYLKDDEILMIGGGCLNNTVIKISDVIRVGCSIMDVNNRGVLATCNFDKTEIMLLHKGALIYLLNDGNGFKHRKINDKK